MILHIVLRPVMQNTPSQAGYAPRAQAAEERIEVRGLQLCVRQWGPADAPPILLLHGWADSGRSFQFLADEMAQRWRLIAPDWRGFGDSAHCATGYFIADYLADLEALLDHYIGAAPARIAGHSLGGNIALQYAGIRPQRVGWVASLDAFGLPDAAADEAPDRYAAWLDQWRRPQAFPAYPDLEAVAARVRARAPRLALERARFVAAGWSRRRADGRYELRHDPAHRRVNPLLYRTAEIQACWQRIRAHCLLLLGRESPYLAEWRETTGAACRAAIHGLETAELDAGHLLHLEQPAALAALLHDFFARAPRGG